MLSAPVSAGSLLSPRIIGSHESPIHSWIAEAIAQNYEKILDIGSGEGYCAVGFALKSPMSAVYAYDINRLARHNDHRRPGITETLVRRFLPSHRIEIRYHCAKAAKEFPILSGIPASEHPRLLEEARPLSQCWIRFLANPSGAIKPFQWW
jgi:hypothetical protein